MEQKIQNSTVIKRPSFGQRFNGYFKNKWNKIKSMTAKDWGNWFLNNAIYFVIIGFILICAFGSPGFFSIDTFANVLRNMSNRVFLALGVGGIIVLTGTDLSAGRIVGFTGCFAAALFQQSDYRNKIFSFAPLTGFFGIFAAIIIVMAIGGLFGTFNGFFVAKFKLHPFIVTLATSLIIFGFSLMFAGLGKSNLISMTTEEYREAANGNIVNWFGGQFILQTYFIFALLAVIITWFMWNYTTFGKNMYAVGANPEAANVSGINVSKTIILVFMYAGLLYGVSGFVEGVRAGAPNALLLGQGSELDAIAACVIGGVSFTGGVGKISGIVVGVLLLVLIRIGLEWLKLTTDYQNLIKGALILFAVSVDMRKYLTKR